MCRVTHAVGIVYRARCPQPSDPTIHDIGGTTSDARCFRRHAIAGLSMSASFRGLAALSEALSDRP